MNFDSSVAKESAEIECSSIVCIELKTKNEDINTTKANIFAS